MRALMYVMAILVVLCGVGVPVLEHLEKIPIPLQYLPMSKAVASSLTWAVLFLAMARLFSAHRSAPSRSSRSRGSASHDVSEEAPASDFFDFKQDLEASVSEPAPEHHNPDDDLFLSTPLDDGRGA